MDKTMVKIAKGIMPSPRSRSNRRASCSVVASPWVQLSSPVPFLVGGCAEAFAPDPYSESLQPVLRNSHR